VEKEEAGLKKARIVVLVVVLALLGAIAAGCGGDQGSQRQADQAAAQGQQSNGGGADTLKKVQDSGEMVVGVKYDQPPAGFIPEGKSDVEGFEVDLARGIAQKLGVEPRFEQVTSKNRIPNLQSGKVDLVIATMTHNRERDKAIDFSVTYLLDGGRLLVPADSDISGVDDLAGKTVAVVQGSTYPDTIRQLAPEAKQLAYQGFPDALQAMLRGEADAVATDAGILVGLRDLAKKAGKDTKIVGERYSSEPLGMGVRENDSAFRDAVNFALMEMVEDGTYKKIFRKWYNEEAFPEVYAPEVWPQGKPE
jgi:polar amino acid transport system substrate-binding protein